MKKSTFTLFLSLFALWLHAQHTIVLSGITFSPNSLTINVGETVTWSNQSGGHNVNGSLQSYPSNPAGFSSGAVAAAPWMFSHTFTVPGTYSYHCDPHFSMGMTGTITVMPAAATGEVVITEIMYNDPTTGTDAYEFIELYNNGTEPVEMEGWTIMDAIVFTFPQYTLPVGGYVILATNAANFEAGFGVPAFQFMGGALSNSGETITLRDPAGNVMDVVAYGNPANGWPAGTSGEGASLVLCDPNADNNDVASWQAASTPTGFVVNNIEVLANPGEPSQCPFGAIVGFLNTTANLFENSGNAALTIAISNGNANPTQVTLELNMSSTATNGSDFQLTLPMTITFPAGQSSGNQVVSVPILNDANIEPLETIVLTLNNPTNGASINPNAAAFTINIIDDDTPFTNALVVTGVFDSQTQPTGLWAKGIELQAVKDVPDASIFGLGSADNGNGSTNMETSLPAISLQEGDCIFVANDSTLFFNFFGFYPEATGNAAGIDGNDAILLFENLIPIDVFGQISVNGTGQPWEYTDGWAYRKSGTGPDGNVFQLSNWTFSGINALDNAATNDEAAVPFPACGYSPIAPTVPTAINDVATTDVDVAVTINVLANDDLPNPLVSLTITSGPDHGTATVNGLDDITYTPNPGFCGTDAFIYEICDMNDCAEAFVTVNVTCPPSYPEYDIATVTTVDGAGLADSVGVLCQIQGIVHGIDFQGNANIQFILIDDTGGISVFSNNDFGYTVTEGDELIVQGTIVSFNCLSQITPDTLWVVSQGNDLRTPAITTFLNESFESELVKLTNLTYVDVSQWLGNGTSFNVSVTNGTFTNVMRIDNDTELASMPAPQAPFNATGLGSQFDSTPPCDGGYQFLPRYAADIEVLNSVVDPALANKIKFHPNPVADQLMLETDLDLARVQITNLLGQVLLDVEKPGNSLSTSSLGKGIYLITFQVEDAIWTDKLVKE